MREDYDDYFEGPDWRVRAAAMGALGLVVAAVVWFGFLRGDGGGGGDTGGDRVASASEGQAVDVDESAVDESRAMTSSTSTSEPDRADVDHPEAESSTLVPARTDSPTTSVPRPTTTVPSPPPVASYATLPDGSPVPVLALFDGDLITLSGTVPSESAAERLRVLALANSSVPDAEVASFLAVDATVPVGVGVRVIEMNSARFPEGSPAISESHAGQLDRVVTIMSALPNIDVEVIGHADQRGDDGANFALSTERARAAADYVTAQGVDPGRVSSRGVGESDLLTLNDDEAALELNRRTEFVFYGLLADGSEPT